jgi:hypothetical protein
MYVPLPGRSDQDWTRKNARRHANRLLVSRGSGLLGNICSGRGGMRLHRRGARLRSREDWRLGSLPGGVSGVPALASSFHGSS